MQRVIEKMARTLDEYDEASLMQLWQHYAVTVREFEPTKRWEEAVLALCLVQAVHWKNQLFNYHLALGATPAAKDDLPPLPDFNFAQKLPTGPRLAEKPVKKATVLSFPGIKKAKPSAGAGPDDSDSKL